MAWKHDFGMMYVKYKIRISRGSTYLSEIDGLMGALQKGGIIILLISTYFHVLVPFYVMFVVWIIQKALEYFIGWYDEKHLHWWAFETKYQQQNPDINPFQFELMTRIKNIEEMIKKYEQ